MAANEELAGKLSGWSTEHAAAVMVFGSMAILILIRRGFRGAGVKGVGSFKIS